MQEPKALTIGREVGARKAQGKQPMKGARGRIDHAAARRLALHRTGWE